MFSRGCCSIVLKCRVGCYFVFVLSFLVTVNFDRCECSRNVSRIFKREVLDGNLQAYLTNFGYMVKSADGAFALRTEESIREAIKEMQSFAGIPVSGKLDKRTAKLMRTPRCGLPDREGGLTSGRRKRYTIHGMKWPYTDLTWSLRTENQQMASDLNPYDVRYVISRALAVWSKHSNLTFTQVDSDRADILIYFYRNEHGDNFPFDGKGVILAHAFFPTGTRASVDVHFDADENWTTSENSESGTNLFNVAAHEVGHSLGLSHSNVEGALMYPWYTEIKDGFEYELPEDDKLAIQFLYGSRVQKQWERIPYYDPQVPVHPQTTSRTTTRTTTTTPTTTTRTTTTTRMYHRYPYDPRYPNGKYPYNRPEKTPHKPMHPDRKPHYPKHNHNPHGTDRRYPHYRNPTDHQPVTNPPYHKPTKIVPRKFPQTPKKAPERTTPVPPKEYPNTNKPPDTCDTNYDAVAVIRRELFIFKDKYFWRIGENGLVTMGYPAEITRLFRGFPRNLTHVDAVYERPDGNIIFFVGTKYYLFSGVSLVSGYPKPITELGLSNLIEKIDGAMVWGHNGRTYFFSGDMYWRFDEEEQKVELDYPRNMVAMWKGVGTDIDAVFQWKDGKTYFFKGKGFWKFNDLRMRVDHWEQKLSAPVWMGCKQNYEQNDLNQKLPYTNLSSSSALMTFDRWLTGMIGILICRVFL